MQNDNEIDIVADETPEIKSKLGRPTVGPSVFDVSLNTYPVQPWINPKAQMSQWFNYGFNPATFTRYALRQTELYKTNSVK
jgi:hypothetical protein